MKANWWGPLLVVVAIFEVASGVRAAPLGTGFTYQGQLKQSGVPLNGTPDFVFTLWDGAGSGDPPTGGKQVGNAQAINALPVTAGLFTVTLNADGEFGGNAFNGDARWLEIAVCITGCGGPETFTTLQPRQLLSATPHALQTRGIVVDAGGRAGIGTKNPINRLSVAGNADFSENIGIGTGTPTAMLHLQRPLADTGVRFETSRIEQGPPLTLVLPPMSASTSGDGRIWKTPGASIVSDDARATTSLSAAVGQPDPNVSMFLNLSNLNFALPAQAQIVGITVQAEGQGPCDCSDCSRCNVRITAELLGGAGPSQTRFISLETAETNQTAGGTFDLWGLEWTAAQVNAPMFGVRLSAELQVLSCVQFPFGCVYFPCDCTGTGSAAIDAVTIAIHYYDGTITTAPLNWSLGLSEDDVNFRIAATPDLSSPTLVVSPLGSVGIGTTEFSGGFFKLAVNGAAAKPNGGQWSALSDARLKRGVEPLKGVLERLLSLRGVSFEFTEEGLRTGLALPGRQTGLIAQEVEAVFPEWVSQSSSGYKFLSEHGTTALFVEALRDLRAEKDAQIADNESEIAELKERLARLEAILAKPIRREKEGD